MLFNSLDFAIFLPVVFGLYWFVARKSLILQNTLLLVASYYFYACWDWRFLFLLIFSTLLDYGTGILIHGSKTLPRKKAWLWLSITVNLGLLGVFKYFDFFVESFSRSLSYLGLETNPWVLSILLPVGISFYTFHGLSYVIDIYKGKIGPERGFINYAVFVSFFPLLVAGPIERATHLLPQILTPRKFSYAQAADGMRQILWGLFKKVVIADNCAQYADLIFENSADYSGSTLLLGAFFFTVQIYGDFSGYSDIALGTARLFGIELLQNFSFPYFSRDIAEFWRRWHISLTTWFRDYVYIPLGGSKGGIGQKLRNTFIIFLLSGLWHGANWTFIAWGFLNALYFVPLLLLGKNRRHLSIVAEGKLMPTAKEVLQIAITFCLTLFAWIFFRAENISHALQYIGQIFSVSAFTTPGFPGISEAIPTLLLIVFFFVAEWLGREQRFAIASVSAFKRPVRYSIYYGLVLLIMLYGNFEENEFIYFQF